MNKQVANVSTNVKSKGHANCQNQIGKKRKAASTCLPAPQGNKPFPNKPQVCDLKSRDWKRQLGAFLHAHGSTRFNHFQPVGDENLRRLRTKVMFETANFLRSKKLMTNVAEIRPKRLEIIIQHWQELGMSRADQVIYFHVLRWFWRVRGIVIASPFDVPEGNRTVEGFSVFH